MRGLIKNWFHLFIGVMFCCAILLPMVVSIAEPDAAVSNAEKRRLSQWPQWQEDKSLKDYFTAITEYTNDHFGFRDALITLKNRISWNLSQSPSQYVIRGSDDWLFLKIKDPLLSQHSKSTLTITNIIKRRAAYVNRMYETMAAQGIHYQHIVAANKMNVYREHLPAIYSLTDIDASHELFRSQFNANELNRQFFTNQIIGDAKANHTSALYFKNDTHWNELGAYLVFKQSIEEIQNKQPQLAINFQEKKFGRYTKYSGDLATYIGLGDDMYAEEPYTRYSECAKPGTATLERLGVTKIQCGSNQSSLLLIGDSFAAHLVPYYGEAVGTLYSVNQSISRERLMKLIVELRPDIVVEEIVERNLAQPISK